MRALRSVGMKDEVEMSFSVALLESLLPANHRELKSQPDSAPAFSSANSLFLSPVRYGQLRYHGVNIAQSVRITIIQLVAYIHVFTTFDDIISHFLQYIQ